MDRYNFPLDRVIALDVTMRALMMVLPREPRMAMRAELIQRIETYPEAMEGAKDVMRIYQVLLEAR